MKPWSTHLPSVASDRRAAKDVSSEISLLTNRSSLTPGDRNGCQSPLHHCSVEQLSLLLIPKWPLSDSAVLLPPSCRTRLITLRPSDLTFGPNRVMTLERLSECQGQNRVRSFRPACHKDCQYRRRSHDRQETSLQSIDLELFQTHLMLESLRLRRPALRLVFHTIRDWHLRKHLRFFEMARFGLFVAVVLEIPIRHAEKMGL